MENREDILKELGENAPQLSKIKGDGFSVPEGYFDDLSELVLTRVKQEVATTARVPQKQGFLDALLERLSALLQPQYAAIALGSIAVLLTTVFLLSRSNSTIETLAFEDLKQTEVVQYIEGNLDTFEEELFLQENTPIPENEYLEGILEELDVNTLEELF
ncbi:MAG: hypothetical protein AAFO82_12210 [Bacteroidota bacterium]